MAELITREEGGGSMGPSDRSLYCGVYMRVFIMQKYAGVTHIYFDHKIGFLWGIPLWILRL